MRKAFAQAVIAQCSSPEHLFLTGDLGFMALEEVREALGERFINCGVAEQNMISVAAGLAREGLRAFAYSIAPFCYARPFEQIRNDICFGRLPVCLVGNGGGYAYGYMGPTHHALEDCAAMTALGVRVLAPAFDEDIAHMLRGIWDSPVYLRLGYDVRPKEAVCPAWAPWRPVLAGRQGVIVALGPLAGLAWKAFASVSEERRPTVWAVTELPVRSEQLPEPFLDAVRSGHKLAVLEEHIQQGGLGMQLLYALAQKEIFPGRFEHRYALGYPSGRYGSQNFHRKDCGLDAESLLSLFP